MVVRSTVPDLTDDESAEGMDVVRSRHEEGEDREQPNQSPPPRTRTEADARRGPHAK